MSDSRVVYGACCAWWDSIDKAGHRGTDRGDGLGRIPACPHCKGVLFEMASIEEWWTGVDAHEAKEPGYRKYVEWQRGKCHPSYEAGRRAYSEACVGDASGVGMQGEKR